MRIRATKSFAGRGFDGSPGRVITVPDDVAQRLIEAGLATAEDSDPAPADKPAKTTPRKKRS